MGVMDTDLSAILKDVRAASENISADNSETNERISAVENSVNELYRKANRPGSGGACEDDRERKDAHDYCVLKHEIDVPKTTG